MRVKLCRGIGTEGKSHCVMAATAMLNYGVFTDRPSCVDPVITDVLITLNDYGYFADPWTLIEGLNFIDNKVVPGFSIGQLGEDCPQERDQELGHLPWIIIGTRHAMLQIRQRFDALLRFMFPDVTWTESPWDCGSDSVCDFADYLLKNWDKKLFITGVFLRDQIALHRNLVGIAHAVRLATRVYLLDIQNRLSPADYKQKRRELIAFIENVLVPMYTEAPKEESYADRIKNLHLQENDNASCNVS